MGTGDHGSAAAGIPELLNELEGTPIGERMRDPEFRRRHAYEALRHHADPIMREIGQQLRDGGMRPSDVLRVPAYAEAFLRTTEEAGRRLDARRITAELHALLDEQRRGHRAGGDTGNRYDR